MVRVYQLDGGTSAKYSIYPILFLSLQYSHPNITKTAKIFHLHNPPTPPPGRSPRTTSADTTYYGFHGVPTFSIPQGTFSKMPVQAPTKGRLISHFENR
jgi:hypothetical protein